VAEWIVRRVIPTDSTVSLIDHTVYFQHLERSREPILVSFSLVGLGHRYDILPQLIVGAAIVALYSVTPWRARSLRLGLALILGGMLSSGMDAVFRSSITDFVGIGSLAVTNLADVSLVSGGILCVFVPILLILAPEKLPWKVFRNRG